MKMFFNGVLIFLFTVSISYGQSCGPSRTNKVSHNKNCSLKRTMDTTRKNQTLVLNEVKQKTKDSFLINISASTENSIIYESDNVDVAYVKGDLIHVNHDIPGEAFIYAHIDGDKDYKPSPSIFIAHITTHTKISNTQDDFSDELVLYPNPVTNGIAMIKTGASINIKDVQVMDKHQKQIYVSTENQRGEVILYTDRLSSGTYFVKIQTNEGLFVKEMLIK